MPDLADDHAAFREAMARAEAASGIVRDADGTELNGIEAFVRGETPDVTEQEGAVPVQASDQPLDTEPVVEETPDTSGQQEVAPTVEELLAEREKLRAQVEEQKLMIGRQSTEVGQTREQMSRIEEEIAALKAQTPAPQPPQAPVTLADIENDPAEAVQRAFAQRDQAALERAFAAWKDPDLGDPFAAASWLADQKLAQQKAEFDARIAETRKQIEDTTAPALEAAAQSAETKTWAEAFDKAKVGKPDFIENAARLLEEVAPEYPSFLPVLQNGTAQEKAEALSALYALDKMGNPQAVQQQLESAAEEAAAEAAAALRGASAVNGQSTVGQGSELATEEELVQQGYIARARSKPSLAKGWTGRG